MKNKIKQGYNVSRETLFLAFKVTLIFAVILQSTLPTYSAIEVVPGLTTDTYLLIDKDSEVILAGENYDEVMGIASITKLMSYYVYMDKIKADNIDVKNTMIPVSDEIVDNFSKDPALSGVYFDYGSEYSLDKMLNLMLVYSDNGATKAIGEYLYGTEEEAVKAMNKKCKTLGLEKTKYYNVSGLTMGDYKKAMLDGTKASDYNVSTAREQIVLAKSLLDKYPEILDRVGKSKIKFDGYTLSSFNLMLPNLDYDYPGVKGLKTGSSIEAGYCFLGYYINPTTKKEYLSIVLNSEDRNKRFNDTTLLYNWLDTVEMNTLMSGDTELELSIKGAKGSFFTVATNADYQTVNTNTYNLQRSEFEYNPKYFDSDNILKTDIPEGGIVGSYVYTIADSELEKGENVMQSLTSEPNQIKFQVEATTEIKKEGFIGHIITSFTNFFLNVFESI